MSSDATREEWESTSSATVVEWAVLVVFSVLRMCAIIQTAASAIGYAAKSELPLASQEVDRLRRGVLSSAEEGAECGQVALVHVVDASLAGFGELPVEARTALARDVRLDEDEALALQSALVSLLYNVQFHAHASEVVVHADCVDDAWEVSVCDDGVGFDPATTSYGFGLQSQVIDSLKGKGMAVEVASRPGEGTCVVIRGRRHMAD